MPLAHCLIPSPPPSHPHPSSHTSHSGRQPGPHLPSAAGALLRLVRHCVPAPHRHRPRLRHRQRHPRPPLRARGPRRLAGPARRPGGSGNRPQPVRPGVLGPAPRGRLRRGPPPQPRRGVRPGHVHVGGAGPPRGRHRRRPRPLAPEGPRALHRRLQRAAGRDERDARQGEAGGVRGDLRERERAVSKGHANTHTQKHPRGTMTGHLLVPHKRRVHPRPPSPPLPPPWPSPLSRRPACRLDLPRAPEVPVHGQGALPGGLRGRLRQLRGHVPPRPSRCPTHGAGEGRGRRHR
jgi:hypothetical protein